MLEVEGHQLERVFVVDDDPLSREIYAETLEDAELTPIPANGSYSSVDELVDAGENFGVQAVLCDFHLAVGNYAAFDGARAVSQWYQRDIPALLCTNFGKAQVDEMRSWRQYIPVLLRPDQLEPESLHPSFGACIREMNGQYTIRRKPYRSLVYVVDRDDRAMYVQLPSWEQPSMVVDLLRSGVPEDIWELARPGRRLHAEVNIGAREMEELYFKGWEVE